MFTFLGHHGMWACTSVPAELISAFIYCEILSIIQLCSAKECKYTKKQRGEWIFSEMSSCPITDFSFTLLGLDCLILFKSKNFWLKKTGKCAISLNYNWGDKSNHLAQWTWQKIFNLLWNLLSFEEIHVLHSLAINFFHLFINSFSSTCMNFRKYQDQGIFAL